MRWIWAGCGLLWGLLSACSGSDERPAPPSWLSPGPAIEAGTGAGGHAGQTTDDAGEPQGSAGMGSAIECEEPAKLIYLVSAQGGLYSFKPTVDGSDAYRFIGSLDCPSSSTPQSMSVDRSGRAWVFYSAGQMFHVSTVNASCRTTTYEHPVQSTLTQLGMGFTAAAPQSSQQILYIISPNFGLATVDTQTLQVEPKQALVGTAAELTGGADAKLFVFHAGNGELAELDTSDFTQTPLHRFEQLAGAMAWAFARYDGKFYIFTAHSDSEGLSRTTVFDPATGKTKLRDENLGFTVVGAGQSTCVPAPML